MSRAKAKGTSFETAIVNYLNSMGVEARRTPLTGALDTGDIELTDNPSIIIEAKNVKAMSLSSWVAQGEEEAANADAAIGPVWHKKAGVSSPGGAYVTMAGSAFVLLLGKLQSDQHTIEQQAFDIKVLEKTIDTLIAALDNREEPSV